MQLLKRFLAAIAGSKKAVATVAGVLFTLAVRPVANWLGADITEADTLKVLGLLAGYLIAQGWADSGKEAAKIAAAPVAAPAKSGKPTVVK